MMKEKGLEGIFALFAVLTILVIGGFIVLFPYQETRTERFVLLPGDHTLAEEIASNGVRVHTAADFLLLASGKETSVEIGDGYIVYGVVEEGRLFQYRQYRDYDIFNYEHKGEENPRIRDGTLTRTLHRDWAAVRVFGLWGMVAIAAFWGLFAFCYYIYPPVRQARVAKA